MVSEEQTFAALQKQYGIRPPKAPTEPAAPLKWLQMDLFWAFTNILTNKSMYIYRLIIVYV